MKEVCREQVERTIQNLKKNQMEAVFFPTGKELLAALDTYVKDGAAVSFGGSMTLFETGVMEWLRQKEKEGRIRLLDRDREGIAPEEVQKIYRDSFFSDVYFCSSNAITEDGCLYNVDGNGNRVAAMIFGPRSVVVVAGVNKIVKDKEEAVRRVETVAAPKNAQRLRKQTPCAQTGTCMHCMAEDRICASYVFLGRQRVKNRIKVLLVGEDYGY